jgi:hypothetical protein
MFKNDSRENNFLKCIVCLAMKERMSFWVQNIVVTYEIRVFFEGAEKEVFSSIFKKAQKNVKYAYV